MTVKKHEILNVTAHGFTPQASPGGRSLRSSISRSDER